MGRSGLPAARNYEKQDRLLFFFNSFSFCQDGAIENFGSAIGTLVTEWSISVTEVRDRLLYNLKRSEEEEA